MDSLENILLVEDSLRDAELALEGLREHRLANEVVHVRDGAEALDYLYRRGAFADRLGGQPAVVLLDLKMPRVDGLEVLRQVRNDPALKRIPLVVMTSSREEQDLVASYQLGANAFLLKPVQFHGLVDAMKLLGGFWAVFHEPPRDVVRRTGDA